MALKTTLVTKDNLDSFVSQILAGVSLVVSAAAPTGYTRQFQHTDWIDFVDPVQAGGGNGFNQRFHALESEFDLVSAAITSVDNALTSFENQPPAIGLSIALAIADGASIPVPAGFQMSETKFFAFPKLWSVDMAQRAGTSVGFSVFANDTGVISAIQIGGNAGASLLATGIAIAKKGGW